MRIPRNGGKYRTSTTNRVSYPVPYWLLFKHHWIRHCSSKSWLCVICYNHIGRLFCPFVTVGEDKHRNFTLNTLLIFCKNFQVFTLQNLVWYWMHQIMWLAGLCLKAGAAPIIWKISHQTSISCWIISSFIIKSRHITPFLIFHFCSALI